MRVVETGELANTAPILRGDGGGRNLCVRTVVGQLSGEIGRFRPHRPRRTRQAVAAAVRQSGAALCATAQPSWTSMNRALGRGMSGSAAFLVVRAAPFNGFGDGHPANTQSSKNCPPAIWMSGPPRVKDLKKPLS
jgi:hypothetical protein